VDTDETRDLISSEKVDGTAVYSRDGDKLGSIHHFMVGKRSGQVQFAVLGSGGIFGVGSRYRPVPWEALSYDTELDGYVLGADIEHLKTSPFYESDSEPEWNRDYRANVSSFYGVALP